MIKSASAKSAPISVAPSISNAPMSTLPAVDMVFSLLSSILPASCALVIVPDKEEVG